MQMYPPVYADLSGFAFNPGIPREEFHDYLHALIRAGFGKRLMFGSGLSPTDWTTDFDAALESIESAVFLTQDQKEDIFYNNAARFLRLKNRDSLREETDEMACSSHVWRKRWYTDNSLVSIFAIL